MRTTTRASRPYRNVLVGSGLLVILALAVLLPGSASAQMQADRVAVGDQAVDFTLTSTDGESFSLSDVRGEKNVIVIFFRGTW